MKAQPLKPVYVNVVADNWGGRAPAWVQRLAHEADRSSLRQTASKISRSPSLVSQVFKNCYIGDMADVEERVQKYLGEKVDCPVLGHIDGADCLMHQKAKYNGSNHAAVTLFVACQRCPHNMTCRKVQS